MDIRKLFKSFRYAFQGVLHAFREQNFRFHVLVAIMVISAGWLTGLSQTEWFVIIIVIAIMLTLEMLNTAIERVVDLATSEIHPLAKQSKDLAAGAVLVFACASAIIGILIFLPKWMNLLT
ncbi:diacylglycerol kinase family protein [Viridibacillus sp. YIM B01967]|uniref:Diacylglycerol kinase family protein n=1 Tax=Viridibacillus soli TaxID=2798301 RepID=A0ABS1H1P3_9BACL|nr:diacylglycerol kinase family protein [Viridibacillus soli]MBK3493322.1 diacylglycerol kinase family protein [Viridibacillus soli]